MKLKLTHLWIFVLCLVLALFAGGVFAKPKVQKFDLDKPMIEQVFLCLALDDLKPMHEAAVKGDMEQVRMLSFSAQIRGRCGAFPVEITYKKLVLEGSDADGNLYTVYEAIVDGHTVYVPLKNYHHRGDI